MLKVVSKGICVLLILLMLILIYFQFVPFWTAEDDTASISEFIWQPSDHKTIKRDFKANVDKNFNMNDIYAGPVLVLVSGILAIVLCIVFFGRIYACLASAMVGVIGIWCYHSHAVFQLGANWQLHFAIAIAIAVIGAIGAMLCALTFFKNAHKVHATDQ